MGSSKEVYLGPYNNCLTCYEIYIPNDLVSHPQILLISRNPHSHPDPQQTRTPGTIKKLFLTLLEDTGWRLAEMTPRKLSTDAGFMASFRLALGWKGAHAPPISALHPSLGNLDQSIEKLRLQYFPEGIGLAGMFLIFYRLFILKLIVSKKTIGAFSPYQMQKELPKSEQYVQHVETIRNIPDHDQFAIIICMLPAMSELLLKTKRPTIDTSFKRATGYQEFEIEAWFPKSMKCMCLSLCCDTWH